MVIAAGCGHCQHRRPYIISFSVRQAVPPPPHFPQSVASRVHRVSVEKGGEGHHFRLRNQSMATSGQSTMRPGSSSPSPGPARKSSSYAASPRKFLGMNAFCGSPQNVFNVNA